MEKRTAKKVQIVTTRLGTSGYSYLHVVSEDDSRREVWIVSDDRVTNIDLYEGRKLVSAQLERETENVQWELKSYEVETTTLDEMVKRFGGQRNK